jgi:hypothetical protein
MWGIAIGDGKIRPPPNTELWTQTRSPRARGYAFRTRASGAAERIPRFGPPLAEHA